VADQNRPDAITVSSCSTRPAQAAYAGRSPPPAFTTGRRRAGGRPSRRDANPHVRVAVHIIALSDDEVLDFQLITESGRRDLAGRNFCDDIQEFIG
jgi:hypothetical protein